LSMVLLEACHLHEGIGAHYRQRSKTLELDGGIFLTSNHFWDVAAHVSFKSHLYHF
jgi:hypothetical protein